MEADNQFQIKGTHWYPRFKNVTTEREFKIIFNAEALKSGRIGVLFILIVWSGFAWFDMHLDDHVRANALFFRLVVITPLFIVILAAFYSIAIPKNTFLKKIKKI